MRIRFKNITRDKSSIGQVSELYHTAFPEDERAPFRMLLSKAEKPNVSFFSCYDGEEWIGLLYVVNYRDLSYVFYFAVEESRRGRGFGTAILKAAQKKYRGRRLFLAIEEVDEKYENYPQRLSRQHFYERAGFRPSGQKMQEGKVIYDLMTTGGRVSPKEYRRLITSYAGLLPLFFTMKIL